MEFNVKAARKSIGSFLCVGVWYPIIQTRWNTFVPRKVKSTVWCLLVESRKKSVSSKGVYIPNILCLVCSSTVESVVMYSENRILINTWVAWSRWLEVKMWLSLKPNCICNGMDTIALPIPKRVMIDAIVMTPWWVFSVLHI